MSMREHDEEPVHGLPAELPHGERILWQGSPDAPHFAFHAFHARAVAIWFALIALWRVVGTFYDGGGAEEAFYAALWMTLPASLALALLGALALGYARTTVYTLTSERVVIRSGIALTVTINIPYGLIDSAAIRSDGDGTGDLVLSVNPKERVSWFFLWPNVRPWRQSRPEPMLRAIPEVSLVASLLARELRRNSRADAVVEAEVEAPVPALAMS